MGTYEGDLNPDGQRHGFGVLLCDNGNSYEGKWKKDAVLLVCFDHMYFVVKVLQRISGL